MRPVFASYQRDADVAGVEHLAQLVADQVDDRLEIELGGHALLDAVDDRELGVRCSVSFSSRCVSSKSARSRSATPMLAATVREQAHLGFAECVLTLVVPKHDHAGSSVAADDRRVDGGTIDLVSAHRIDAIRSRPSSARVPPCCAMTTGERVRSTLPPIRREAADRGARETLCRVRTHRGVRPDSSLRSYQRMPMVSPVLNISRSLSPTRSMMAWKSSFDGQPLLDAVDDRELGGALLGLLQQPLRLVEEARILERDAHARGDRAEQAHLGLAECVLTLVILDDDVPSTRSLPMMGTRTADRLSSVPGTAVIPECGLFGAVAEDERQARRDHRLRTGPPGRMRERRKFFRRTPCS